MNSYVGGCYFEIAKGGGWWQIYNTWLLSDMTTDDLWDGNTTQDDGYQDVTHFMPTAQSNGILQNFWGARYQGITTCNIGIERIPASNINEQLKNRRLAEVRFLRAFFYFDLVRNFGGVPIITSYTGNADGVGRNTQEEVYKFVEDELKAVADVLPSAASMPQPT